jgi:hypothetical protein
MGSWGTGSFENDGALDFLGMLLYREDEESIVAALQEAIEIDDPYVDIGQYAIAAAQTVAALNGVPSTDLPADLMAWVQSYPAQPNPQLATMALQALACVQADGSEIYQLWEETEYFDEWQAVVSDLKRRLESVANS